MKLTIFKRDIDAATRGYAGSCPIALAARRTLIHTICYAYDDTLEVQFPLIPSRGAEFYYLPESAMAFMESFDEGEEVKPCTFNLQPNNGRA